MDQIPPPDFAAARNNMVDSQIRPNRVTDPRVIDAMRTLPREQFVPPHLAALAYIDEDLPLGGGRVLMEPLVLAWLLQSARIRNGERVLVVASGTGYGAAIAAACSPEVTALEEDEALMAVALRVLPKAAPSVKLAEGRLAAGLPGGAPWDVIVIEGAVASIPEAFAAQLSASGRLVTVLRAPGAASGRAVLAERAGSALRTRDTLDCGTAALPGFVPAPSFVF